MKIAPCGNVRETRGNFMEPSLASKPPLQTANRRNAQLDSNTFKLTQSYAQSTRLVIDQSPTRRFKLVRVDEKLIKIVIFDRRQK